MIFKKMIGEFVLTVGDPYPMWIEVRRGEHALRFTHTDLADLEHAIRCARDEIDRAQPDKRP